MRYVALFVSEHCALKILVYGLLVDLSLSYYIDKF